MAEALWTIDAVVAGADGRADGETAPGDGVTGISIDTRTLAPGELFVALKDERDGHEFVPAAFAKGAAAALVSESYARKDGDGVLIRVNDVLRALELIGMAARARLSSEARCIAVTGSAGKTTTKEMARLALSPQGRCHASDKSYNNHWGVPLTLARMPADTRFGVFEIGMNHAGEITPLTQMVRPDIAIVTTVEAAHLEAFNSVEDIARAKAEIFAGLEPGGTAVLNRDNPYYALLREAAIARPGVNIVSFGSGDVPQGDGPGSVTLVRAEASGARTQIAAGFGHTGADAAEEISFSIGASGRHMVLNALAVMAACRAAGVDIGRAAEALSSFGPPAGRGSRQDVPVEGGLIVLIDESYNANPASMRAALETMALYPRDKHPRRIAVLGDMLELGDRAQALHEGLAEAIDGAQIDLIFAAGPMMQHLYDCLPAARQGMWAATSAGLEDALRHRLGPGDVVMIKGSNGSRMAHLVQLVRALGAKAA